MADIIIIMGPTGAGKTIQSKRLAHELDYRHLSTGELLRADASMASRLVSGELAPTNEVEEILERAVLKVPIEQGIILDGFPRLLEESEWLNVQLDEWKRDIRRVIFLDIDAETSRQRLSLRARADDSSRAMAEKWRIYEEQTRPVLQYYEDNGSLVRVDGRSSEEEVYNRIKKVFNI